MEDSGKQRFYIRTTVVEKSEPEMRLPQTPLPHLTSNQPGYETSLRNCKKKKKGKPIYVGRGNQTQRLSPQLQQWVFIKNHRKRQVLTTAPGCATQKRRHWPQQFHLVRALSYVASGSFEHAFGLISSRITFAPPRIDRSPS